MASRDSSNVQERRGHRCDGGSYRKRARGSANASVYSQSTASDRDQAGRGQQSGWQLWALPQHRASSSPLSSSPAAQLLPGTSHVLGCLCSHPLAALSSGTSHPPTFARSRLEQPGMQSLTMRVSVACAAAPRPQAGRAAAAAAPAAATLPARPRAQRRAEGLRRVAAQAGEAAPAEQLQSFATTEPQRVRGGDGQLAPVSGWQSPRGSGPVRLHLEQLGHARVYACNTVSELLAANGSAGAGRGRGECTRGLACPPWVPRLLSPVLLPALCTTSSDARHPRRVRCVRLHRRPAVRGHLPQGGCEHGHARRGAARAAGVRCQGAVAGGGWGQPRQ